MASYIAELDLNNIVLRVLRAGDDIADKETWASNILGGTWKQTYIDGSQRKQFAGIGMVYDPVKDKFLNAQPYASWSLDANDDWQAPIAKPTESNLLIDENTFYVISWDDSAYQTDNNKGWKSFKSNDTSENHTMYDWNGSSWVLA